MNYSSQFLASMLAARQFTSSSSAVAAMVFAGRRENGAKLADLARLLGISSAAVTGVIDTLERMDLAERRRMPGDRRTILVTLTPKGRDALNLILNPQPNENV